MIKELLESVGMFFALVFLVLFMALGSYVEHGGSPRGFLAGQNLRVGL